MKRLALVAVAAAAVASAAGLSAQGAVEVIPVRGGIYMLATAAGNTTVQVGTDGVLVVDSQTATVSDAILAEIRKLSDQPIRYVLNTSGDPDHVGGNRAIAGAGRTFEGGNTRAATVYSGAGAPIWAHEGVLNRLTREAAAESQGWPTDTFFVEQKDLFMNSEPVQLLHAPSAHTDGDMLVVFRRSDVIATGDIYTPNRYPVIDVAHGGGINGLIDALNHVLRITVPEFNQQGGTMVIPGHGRLSDEADVSDYRDMVTIVRDRVRDLVTKKQTLDQVKAARLTRDYDPIFGEAAGVVFVESVYRSLTQPARPAGAR
jgi:cyclase